MKSILDTVIKVEDEAKTLVQDAQKKARHIKEKAETENTARVEAARKKAASRFTTSINQKKKEWQDKIQQTVSAQETLYTDLINNNSDQIEQTADRILVRIITPRYKDLNE